MEAPKLEWMYKNSSEVVDREEYLLGRPIDRAFEQTSLGNEIEKDCLPTPVLSNSASNIQVDVLRKLKEDPLEIIRQQEIERRKQLLKNPVKLKKLQNMLKEKQETQNGDERKKPKKKSRSKQSSDEDSQDIDSLLTSKYLSLMKKHGIKSLSDLVNVNVEKKKKRKKEKKKSSKHEDTSESESDEDQKTKKYLSKRKYYESSSSDSDSENEKKPIHQRRKHKESTDEDHSEKPYDRNKKNHKSRSPSPYSRKKTHKDNVSQAHGSRDYGKQKDNFRDSKYRGQSYNSSNKDKRSSGLSEEEKQKRLQEMMGNAKWRDELRVKNVTRYKKEEAAEQKETEYNEDFMRKQMAIATSVGTVESRIKSNINNIQRSKFSMNENFARR